MATKLDREVNYHEGLTTHKVTQPFDNVVFQNHMAE